MDDSNKFAKRYREEMQPHYNMSNLSLSEKNRVLNAAITTAQSAINSIENDINAEIAVNNLSSNTADTEKGLPNEILEDVSSVNMVMHSKHYLEAILNIKDGIEELSSNGKYPNFS